MKIANTNTLGAKGSGLPYPVTLNPELYLSRTNGKFNKSTNGTIYVNEWIDPYSGLKATQDTGDYRPELVDGGVKFDGVNDYLNLGKKFDFTSNDDFSFVFYVYRLSVSSGNHVIFYKGKYGTNSYYIDLSQDAASPPQAIRFTSSDGNNSQRTVSYGDNIQTNKWYFIVITRNGGSVTIYLDNVNVTDTQDDHSVIASSSDDFLIGKYKSLSSSVHEGFLDEISIYPYALTQNQITNLYNYTKQLKGIA